VVKARRTSSKKTRRLRAENYDLGRPDFAKPTLMTRPPVDLGGRPRKVTLKQSHQIQDHILAGENKIAEAVYVKGGASLKTLQDHIRALRKKLTKT
jgi:hypothetical protein